MNPNKSPFGSYDEAPEDKTDEPPKQQEIQAPPPKPFSLDFGSKAPDFLSQIMGKENDPDDDDEKRKEKEKKEPKSGFFDTTTPEDVPVESPKTWRNLISGTLPKLDKPKEQPVITETDNTPTDFTLPENQTIQSQIDQIDSTPPELEAEADRSPTRSVEQAPSEPQIQAEDEPISQAPVDVPTSAPKTPNSPPPVRPNSPPIQTPNAQNTYNQPPNPNVATGGQATGNVLPPSPNIPTRNYNQLPNNPPVTTERVIERKPVGAILAFVGAEVLSRRRDKKLGEKIKKEAKTRKETLDELQKHQKNQLIEIERRRELDASRQRSINEQNKKQTEQLDQQVQSAPEKPFIIPEVPPPVIYENVSKNSFDQRSYTSSEIIDNSLGEVSEIQAIPTETRQATNLDRPASRASEILETRYGRATQETVSQSQPERQLESKPSFEYAQRYDSAEFDPRARRSNARRSGDSKINDQSSVSPVLPPVYASAPQNSTHPQPQATTPHKQSDPPYKKPIQYGIGAALFILTLAIVAAYLTN